MNYSWNTGASAATIWASKQGTYSVSAQSANGCYSRDTLNVLKLFSLPDVKLDQNNWICEGGFRALNAGSGYLSYLWQDGSNSSVFNIDTTGTFWVQVTDHNHCVSSDTVYVTRIIPKSTGFLPLSDTLICDGYPLKIQAEGQFITYNWNTGDQNSYIIIKKAGNYSLTVTDQYGCTSTSSLSVQTKQCLSGILFPNAFSPNNDGHNDLFRPSVLGNIRTYQLQIFNRWGQKVFESADFTKGWEGKIGGMMQVSAVYVWLCHYQFEGETEKSKSGTVFLLR
jgi:gliding motility-associated-like protein